MEFLKSLDPKVIAAWLQLLAIAIGLFAMLRAKWREEVEAKKLSRWDFIKEAVPEVHGVVQRMAKLSKTKKDDEFVAIMDKLLDVMGLLPVQSQEKEAVKALGAGYHQEFKLLRAAASIPADLLPIEEAPKADPSHAPAEPLHE